MHLQMVLQVPVHAAMELELCQRTLPISPEPDFSFSPDSREREVLPDVSVQGSSYLGAAILATFKGGKSVTLICALFFFFSLVHNNSICI